jgi:cyclopropane-fatty-acyl-phospholipid synthase
MATALARGLDLEFRTARARARALLFGHVGLLESYFDGEIDLKSDLRQTLAAAITAGVDAPVPLVRLRNLWHELRFSNASREHALRNAPLHYGLTAEFYRAWLDTELMMYTCAYWKDGVRTLEEAQREKAELVCRKILLAPGETVADVGCGFGGFMFHARERHGACVTGVNATAAQVDAVRAEIARRGLGDGLRMVEGDFREPLGEYDKLVSLGVLEHAGRDQLGEVIGAHARLLRPGGLGLLQFIGHVGREPTEFFIRKYVFPGGWIPSLADVVVAMEAAGLEVLDVENLRRHYAATLDAWAERFDRNWARIRALDPARFDERFRRIWRTYLYGCAELFRSPAGRTHLFQITFSRGNVPWEGFPRTRDYMYGTHPHAQAADRDRRFG